MSRDPYREGRYLDAALIAFALAALTALAWIALSGCAPRAYHARAGVDPNAMTPGGVPVRMTPAIEADPVLEAALLEEIDTYGVPPRFMVVVYDTETIPYPGKGYDRVHGYTTFQPREIHAGRFAGPPGERLRVLAHEVLHAACGCWCVDGHLEEERCQ